MDKHRPELANVLRRPYPFNVVADESGGWFIYFPDLPGCMTQAETWDEIAANAREAFEAWVELTSELGHPIPEPTIGQVAPSWPAHAFSVSTREAEPRYGTRQVAERLGITPRRVQELARSRGVGRRIGRALAFSEADVAALANRQPGRPRASRRHIAA